MIPSNWCITLCIAATCCSLAVKCENDRPVIGILAQESHSFALGYGTSYIPGSYVSYVQQSGARAVPIRIKENDDYYETIFGSINGVLFPGGSVGVLDSEYAKAAQKLFKLAKKANDAGDYFPLWGTCLGFELMSALASGKDLLEPCSCYDVQLPLDLSSAYEKSRMFGSMPADVLNLITKYNVTGNYHKCCLTPTTFNKNVALSSFFRILSTNSDTNGLTFISSMEAYEYPFYASQWHPEKNIYTWNLDYSLNHSAGAIRVTQHFSNFLVSEARKSNHSFPNEDLLAKLLFFNYEVQYSGAPTFEYNYFFNYTSEEDASGTYFGLSTSNEAKYEYFQALNELQLLFLMTAGGLGFIFVVVLFRRWIDVNRHALPHPNGHAYTKSQDIKPLVG